MCRHRPHRTGRLTPRLALSRNRAWRDELAPLLRVLSPLPSSEGGVAVSPGGRLPAGGLLVLYPLAGRSHFLLTQRAADLPAHPGQVSLPGGAVEPEDASPLAAALREAWEEVGLRTGRLHLLGALQPVEISVSNFMLHTYVAFNPVPPRLHPNPREVAALASVPLSELLDPGVLAEEEWELRGSLYRVAFFRLAGLQVWGATARVLSQVREALAGPWPPGMPVPGSVRPA